MDLTQLFDDIVWKTLPRIFWAIIDYVTAYIVWFFQPLIDKANAMWQGMVTMDDDAKGSSVHGVTSFIQANSRTFKAVVNTVDLFINVRLVLSFLGLLIAVIMAGFLFRIMLKLWSAVRGAGL